MKKCSLVALFLSLVSTSLEAVEPVVFLAWAASYDQERQGHQSSDSQVESARQSFAERYVGYVNGIADAMSSTVGISGIKSCIPEKEDELRIANRVLGVVQKKVALVRKEGPAVVVVAALASGYPCKK